MKATRMTLVGLIFTGTAFAQYTNRSSVLDGSGTLAAGGTYTSLSAAGQPGGIAVSGGGSFIHQAGFLNTFSLKPELDTDGDGLADELDQDNDNDGLLDLAEVSGSSFSPITPTLVNDSDSDDDGASDRHESVAGSNPWDPDSLLWIADIKKSGGDIALYWLARSNKTYKVRWAGELKGGGMPTNLLIQTTAQGAASPPWYELIHTYIDNTVAGTNRRFYAIQAAP